MLVANVVRVIVTNRTVLTLYRFYFEDISANIKLQVYNVYYVLSTVLAPVTVKCGLASSSTTQFIFAPNA
jgi:hypothetical protein